ncbi:MAG: hypothetical protein GTN76_16460 [Candidatus Aenigmarchaeota archaeon]|nr:hypothetical protein [bacterium]NIO22268.1 hypothetical protein [Candidatus Aenigmarchaeota archaeon]
MDLVICGIKIGRNRYRPLTCRMLFVFVVASSFYLVRALNYPREETAIEVDFPFEFSLASFFLIFMDSSVVESVGV